MTPSDYLKYLLRLIGEDETGSDDDLFGLFQTFRPDGKGVERVFAPLVNGQSFIERILPVYEATASSPAEDAYFVVRREPAGPERALQLGQALSFALSQLSLQIGDPELIAVCKSPNVIACGVSAEALRSDEHLCVYETLGDWFSDLTDYERPEAVLYEAFYSIACDRGYRYICAGPSSPNELPEIPLPPTLRSGKPGSTSRLLVTRFMSGRAHNNAAASQGEVLSEVKKEGWFAGDADRRTVCYHRNMAETITQRELRNDSGEIMRRLDQGESFIVTRNGVPVGELTPLRRHRFVATAAVLAIFRNAPAIDPGRFRADVDALAGQEILPRA